VEIPDWVGAKTFTVNWLISRGGVQNWAVRAAERAGEKTEREFRMNIELVIRVVEALIVKYRAEKLAAAKELVHRRNPAAFARNLA
jgi:hypothetical protein